MDFQGKRREDQRINKVVNDSEKLSFGLLAGVMFNSDYSVCHGIFRREHLIVFFLLVVVVVEGGAIKTESL